MNAFNPEQPESMEAMLARLKTKLGQIGSLDTLINPSLRIEVSPEAVELIEELPEGRTFFEKISFAGDEASYDASVAGAWQEMIDEDIALITQLEEEKGISLESGPPITLTQVALQRILGAVEGL